MKIKAIACEAFAREFYLAAAHSPHVINIELLAFGLHNTPNDLRTTIQKQVDLADEGGFDCIALGYGLCSRGTAEITAGSIPIIMPRMHDCITAFLGSRDRYGAEFSAHPGTYYYSPGWIERKEGDVEQGFIDIHTRHYAERHAEYVEKYGQENADFLIEQERQWYANYTRAAFIDTGIGCTDEYRRFTRALADDKGWEYAELAGDISLIRRLLCGEWEGEDFLVVKPGHTITESFDELILKQVKKE